MWEPQILPQLHSSVNLKLYLQSMLRAIKKKKKKFTVLKTYVYIGLLYIKYVEIRALYVISATLFQLTFRLAENYWQFQLDEL
jgi:hypothetical protein